MMKTLIKPVVSHYFWIFWDPNDDYLRIRILAPDREIGPPVRFWDPLYDFPNRRPSQRFFNSTRFSDPLYDSWGDFFLEDVTVIIPRKMVHYSAE